MQIALLLLLVCGHSLANPVAGTEDPTPTVPPSEVYRLNGDFKPTAYVIDLVVPDNFDEKKTFEGTVIIDVIKANEKAAKLQLHMDEKINSKVKIELLDSSSKLIQELDKKEWAYNKVTEILEIDASVIGVATKLKFTYTGTLYDDLYGFYLSKVSDKEGFIATTQFQPTFARRAFPCFDEPEYKATFKISLKVPKEHSAISNQPSDDPKPTDNKYEFGITPKMSTYLVAFVVSKFGRKEIDTVEVDDVPMTIWAPATLIDNAEYAAKYSRQIINKLGVLLGSTFNEMGINQLDQVAIPDFAAGAMENWGLVTYRETALLVDKVAPKAKDKQRVAQVIAHEFAHSWFGDWVTLKWWKDTWLNEGFATYFESHGINDIRDFTEFELEKQFVVDDIHPIMETDGNAGAAPLSSDEGKVNTVPEIQAKFGTISYSKGGSIVRMMENIVGSDKFYAALTKYITKYGKNENGNTEPKNLFAEFGNIKVDTEDVKFNTIMSNWILKSGYPVVFASYNQGKVEVTQKKFLYNEKDQSTEHYWYVPLWHMEFEMPALTTSSPGSSTTESTTGSSGTESTTGSSSTESTSGSSSTESTSGSSSTESTTTSDSTETTTDASSTIPPSIDGFIDPNPENLDFSNIDELYIFDPSNTDIHHKIKRSIVIPSPTSFLKPDNSTQTILEDLGEKVIIINPHNAGFYRVNYATELWKRITKALKNNHHEIDPMIRAQLIDDAMNLARANQLDYKVAMELLDYLEHETDYYPWKAALRALSYLRKRLVDDPLGKDIEKTMNKLIKTFYEKNKDFSTNETKAIAIYAKVLALEWACELGNEECIANAGKLFKPETRAPTDTIDANLQSIVYCSGLRNSNEDKVDWEKKWKEYKSETSPAKKVIILTALGCTKNPNLLKTYLEKSITEEIRTQDASTVFSAVLTGNPEGIDVSIAFLDENLPIIAEKYGSMGALSNVILQVSDRITTSEQSTKFKTTLTENKEHLLEAADVVENALKAVEANMEWTENTKKQLNEYLNPSSGGNAIAGTSFLALLVCFFVARFA